MVATASCVPPNTAGRSGALRSWPSTSALFRDETGRRELQLAVDDLGNVTAALMGPDLDAFGMGTATLIPVGTDSVTGAATVDLTGYGAARDRFHHFEAAIGATWSVDRRDRTRVEVAGTTMLTDLDDGTVTCYRAVRHHPYNHLAWVSPPTEPPSGGPTEDSTPSEPAGGPDHQPGRRRSRFWRLVA